MENMSRIGALTAENMVENWWPKIFENKEFEESVSTVGGKGIEFLSTKKKENEKTEKL